MLSGLALSPPLSSPSRPKLLQPRKNKCSVVWPSHYRLAQNNYDLEKINVEWLITQKYYNLEKINVERCVPKIIITTPKK